MEVTLMEGPKNLKDMLKTNSKMTEINSSFIVITLKVNRLNSPIKKQRLTEWIKKIIQIHTVYQRLTSHPKTQIDKSEKMKKTFYTKSNKKRAGVTILISDKMDLKSKTVTRDQVIYYILTKGSIH